VIDRVEKLGSRAAYTRQFIRDKLLDHKNYVHQHGIDMPEIRNWKWTLGQEKEKVQKKSGAVKSGKKRGQR
jgi:xylulose-5-phosphate/fructose-6-phosphate phosphoketolase